VGGLGELGIELRRPRLGFGELSREPPVGIVLPLDRGSDGGLFQFANSGRAFGDRVVALLRDRSRATSL
jgi:hypothetical protein